MACFFVFVEAGFSFRRCRVMSTNGEYPEGEAGVNDSPVDCQSSRTDCSIFLSSPRKSGTFL